MPYITSIERLAKEEGSLKTAREALIVVRETRLRALPYELSEFFNQIEDLPRLKQQQARAIASLSLCAGV